jgi:NADH-quinone oxidoreductase subunit J
MNVAFYLAAAVAIASTVMVITRLHAVHALLYLIVSLLSVALIFYILGAPFVAALEVIIYAGAIMVLFVFVVMMLNLGEAAAAQERQWLSGTMWIGPTILAVILLAELFYLLAHPGNQPAGTMTVEPKEVGIALFGPYLIGVELSSMLLLAGLVGAYHLGRRRRIVAGQVESHMEESHDLDPSRTRAAPGRYPIRTGTDRPVGAP